MLRHVVLRVTYYSTCLFFVRAILLWNPLTPSYLHGLHHFIFERISMYNTFSYVSSMILAETVDSSTTVIHDHL